MPDHNQPHAAEKALIARIEKTGASLETNRHGRGFFNAGDDALKLIKKIPGVRFLDLFEACDAGEVSDEGIAHVKGMSELRYLALGPGISDTGLSHLAGLTELRELRLDSARDVTDDGLQYLKTMTKLQNLSLQYTDVHGPGTVHLFNLKKLKELNLEGTPISAAAVEKLRKALPECTVLWDRAKAPSAAKKTPARVAATQEAGRELKLRATLRGHSDKPTYAAFSSDGALLATVGSQVQLWESATGAKLRRIDFKQGALFGVALSPDGKLVASGSNGGCVFVWETASAKKKNCLESATQVLTAVDIDRNAKYLAAGGDDGKIYLWELTKGKLVQSFSATSDDFFCALKFSPDGKSLASCGRESFVAVWNIPAGKKVTELHGPTHKTPYEKIRDLEFSPDGKSLAAAHPDNSVRIWNLSQGKEVKTLQSPTCVVRLSFHPGGQTLATASDGDTLIRLWDLASAKSIAEFQTNADWNAVNFATFDPNGKLLITNGKGGSLLLLSWE